ncbi:MAG: hypothetical protein KIH67_001290 [Candidatus Moranbacteria bacterium]|nr:hypothetical protein [Candidatus Moranbacteria bacterium]
MRISKYVTLFLTALFIGIVVIERFPGVLIDTEVPYEWLMFGLFKISLLDDITHGLSGLLGVAALLAGYRFRVYYLMLIGGYYSLDAVFFLIYGLLVGELLIDNILLNIPHVGISFLVIVALRYSIKSIELK